jgi:cell division septal protein FtsQ
LPKRTRISVISATLLLLFAGLIYLFAWSSVFTAESIEISGAPNNEAKELVRTASGVAIGEKLARIEPRSIEARIGELTWIRDARLSRNWITGDVKIDVESRKPAAYFEGKTIDATGALFLLPGFIESNLPVVTAANPALGAEAIALFATLPAPFQSRIVSLSARNQSNFSMRISHQGREVAVKWGANKKSELKVEVFNALMKLPENQKVRRVDLSAPHAPIVK